MGFPRQNLGDFRLLGAGICYRVETTGFNMYGGIHVKTRPESHKTRIFTGEKALRVMPDTGPRKVPIGAPHDSRNRAKIGLSY